MIQSVVCPRCRRAFPANEVFCPVCELRGALDPEELASGAREESPSPAAGSSAKTPGLTISDLERIRYFAKFELLEEIARGGMGAVFKARQATLNRTVALKVIAAGMLASRETIRRFKVEAEAAAGLDHPNIVRIYEVGEEAGQHYFSMELIDGPTLGKVLGRKPMPTRRAARLLGTIARAVHFAHQRGVLHRDLKPNNILLDTNGEPHLTDFGVAKLLQRDSTATHTNAVIGTPAYMSPEQARGDTKAVTTAVDVYGLGAVLYETLTGTPPFAGGTSYETIQQVLELEPRRPSIFNKEVDRDLETICLKCLEKDPSRRYGSAQAVAEDLERWQRREPILARPLGRLSRSSHWIRRNPIGTSLIVSLSVGLAASLILLQVALDQKKSAEQSRLAAERAREIIWQKIGVSDFWDKPDSTAIVPSEILALVTGRDRSAALASGPIERYRIGMILEEYPVDVIIGYAQLLRHLEEKLSRARHTAVRFDLHLYQENPAGTAALLKRDVDILKIGGQSYLRATQVDPGVTPLISQFPAKTGVIFTRTDSQIHSITDLRNHSIGVGGSSSTVRLWATYYMLKSGIPLANFRDFGEPAGDLSFVTNSLRRPPKLGKGAKATRSPLLHVVLTNGCDAAVVSEKVLLRAQATNAPLRILKTFPSSPVFWLARSNLPDQIATAFQQAMVALHDKEIFNGLVDHVSSYSQVTPEELRALREAAALITGTVTADHEESE